MLKHQEQIDLFRKWQKEQSTLKRLEQLERDEIEVFDYTSSEFSQDTNSELKFKGE